LQPSPPFEEKIIQLYDTFNVRFGVMLVGQSGSGKSTCFKTLAQCSSAMKVAGEKGFERTHYRILNPKSISMGEMYGEVDPFTQEWVDGLASSIIREVNTPNMEDPDWNPIDRYWVVFDGPVDALWIENMNTVLDDNMTLCLANSERIKLRP
jgi:dynein heavy chain